jgi:predicted heme/steroid binding protein
MEDCYMTLEDLKKFDGKRGAAASNGSSVFVAVNGKIFDVTDKGMEFYGPGELANSLMQVYLI